ncbi:hypothetical protein FRC03_002832 [Tulasnella sp. 419]|nr:hypothetical protein FRC03_002832 [Tulasnella sp. 419]
MSLSSKHSVLQPFTPINSSKKSPTYSQARRASIKDEADTKWSVPRELAASVAQSLNQYETRTMQRQHNKDIAEVIARNPIFRGIPTTSVPPILQECPTTS